MEAITTAIAHLNLRKSDSQRALEGLMRERLVRGGLDSPRDFVRHLHTRTGIILRALGRDTEAPTQRLVLVGAQADLGNFNIIAQASPTFYREISNAEAVLGATSACHAGLTFGYSPEAMIPMLEEVRSLTREYRTKLRV